MKSRCTRAGATHPPSPSLRGRGRSGFTLVEVLIAISLMMAVVGTSLAFLQNLLAARERLLAEASMQRSATIAIDRIEAALLTSIAGDGRYGAGVTGEAHSISILTRGVAAFAAENGLQDGRVLGDLQRVELRFSESSGVLEARARAVTARPAPRDDDESPELKIQSDEEISGGEDDGDEFWPLGSFPVVRFRYHDGEQWLDAFDSLSAGRLPAAIEIAIWFEPWPGAEEQVVEEEDESKSESERVFDEDAFAMQSEIELYFETPRPDRIRVIAIPDPGLDETESVELIDEEGGA